jgi:hypothetical protein
LTSLAALMSVLVCGSMGCAQQCPGLDSIVAASGDVSFAVLPVNTFDSTPPELSDASWRLMVELGRHLRARGYERSFVEPALAAQLWRQSVEAAEVSDASERDFRGALRLFAAEVQRSSPFDALIAASLIYREARLRRQYAKWDGAVRKIERPGDDAVEVPESFEGNVPALSLHLMIIDRGGELVYEDYSGLDLAHDFAFDPDGNQLNPQLRDEQLRNGEFLEQGVARAFAPCLQ